MNYDDIQIISAPSILGLRPGGVEKLAGTLIGCGLGELLSTSLPVVDVPVSNNLYNETRDETQCLNSRLIHDFSLKLMDAVQKTVDEKNLPLVLGGDCSILIGIMPALKRMGSYGLVFMDAHADFYAPHQSISGETADMDLAIITGRGPDRLSNINRLKPYVKDENVIHIGQRDWEETIKYGSDDVHQTAIHCLTYAEIEKMGIAQAASTAIRRMDRMKVLGFWVHFDADVLSDEENPAVDYRLPGGLSFNEAEFLLKTLLKTGKIIGISVAIFNPGLDSDGAIASRLTGCIGRALN